MSDAWDAAAPDTQAEADAPPKDAWDAAAASNSQTAAPHMGIAGNIGMGALRGAADIGTTLMWPFDKTAHAINPSNMTPAERRASIGDFFNENADPSSLAFKGGRLGAQVAGTAGVGSALGAGAAALGAPAEAVSALGSGGLSLGGGTTGSVLGNAALRTGAGAVVGGASTALVDPSSTATGAAIGAATPGAAWLAGLAGKAAGTVVGKTASTVLGATTGTGNSAVEAAYHAGMNGDRSFIDNMRGNASFSDIVDQAKDALGQMRDARGAEYRAGMSGVTADRTVLDMSPLRQAVADAQSKFGTFNGQVINENANAALQKVADKVKAWSELDPATFHTPEGLDKLKQWVGGELENAKPGTQTDAALRGIYGSIKGSISTQAPDYARVMSDYESASEQLRDISQTLSLNPKANVDTSVRKLQSVLRNNVNTNFGNRAGAVDALDATGANIRTAVAGQSMSSFWPRGIAGAVDAAAAIPAAIHNPFLAAAAIPASPRLVGESAYGVGRLAGAISRAGPSLPLTPAASLWRTQRTLSLADMLSAQKRSAKSTDKSSDE